MPGVDGKWRQKGDEGKEMEGLGLDHGEHMKHCRIFYFYPEYNANSFQ